MASSPLDQSHTAQIWIEGMEEEYGMGDFSLVGEEFMINFGKIVASFIVTLLCFLIIVLLIIFYLVS